MRDLKVIEVDFLQTYTYFSPQLFQPYTTFFKELFPVVTRSLKVTIQPMASNFFFQLKE
jgi:hypothetical protein